jgi:hypothetical protein
MSSTDRKFWFLTLAVRAEAKDFETISRLINHILYLNRLKLVSVKMTLEDEYAYEGDKR